MENEKRLIDANEFKSLICKCCNLLYSEEPCEPSECSSMLLIDGCPTIDAVEVVQIEKTKQEILQIMDNFITEYNRIGFYGKSDVMDIAKRLVSAALTDLCSNCGAKMDGERRSDVSITD